jgi:hypothetical protein
VVGYTSKIETAFFCPFQLDHAEDDDDDSDNEYDISWDNEEKEKYRKRKECSPNAYKHEFGNV